MRNLLGFFFSLFFLLSFSTTPPSSSSFSFFVFFFHVFSLLCLYSVAATQPAPHVPLAPSHIPFVLPSCCGQLVTLRITAKKKSVICNTYLHTHTHTHTRACCVRFSLYNPQNRKEEKKIVAFIKYFTFFFPASFGSFYFFFFFSQEEVHH